ncbi:MAG: hypothetical protein ISS25_03760 [Nanoarchaeota archaeon]|nr:hypothetical protein [DPANN group archaeon]MBL7116919.1 hypothetical protein [Nanoarchaeota archaeon]
MVHPLIGIHAAFGEIGAFAFLWVLVELLNPSEERIRRAKIAAVVGVVFLFLSWVTAGYYYVNIYGADVKPMIKAGPAPWAHKIFTETKEHLFIFLPFLSILTAGLIFKYKDELIENKGAKLSVLLLSGLVFLIALSMAGMGYIISMGARAALEAGVVA